MEFIKWFISGTVRMLFVSFAALVTFGFAYAILIGEYMDNEVVGFIAFVILVWTVIVFKSIQEYKDSKTGRSR
jgi:hypothetical protein